MLPKRTQGECLFVQSLHRLFCTKEDVQLLTSLSELLCEIVGASGWRGGVRGWERWRLPNENLRISASAPSVTKEMVLGSAGVVHTASTIGLLYSKQRFSRGRGALKSILSVGIPNIISALSMSIIIGGVGEWDWPSRAQMGKLLGNVIVSRFKGT